MKYLKKYNLIKEGIVEDQFKFGNMVMDLIIKENPIIYDVDDVMNEINDILKSFFPDELVVSDRFTDASFADTWFFIAYSMISIALSILCSIDLLRSFAIVYMLD